MPMALLHEVELGVCVPLLKGLHSLVLSPLSCPAPALAAMLICQIYSCCNLRKHELNWECNKLSLPG